MRSLSAQRLVWLAAFVFISLLAGAVPAHADASWLEVSAPSEGETVRAPIALVELRGRVGRGDPTAYDVVLAVDRSQSTLLPTGIDLDHDGIVGALSRPGRGPEGVRGPYPRWTTDIDDIVANAELTVARKLLSRLDPARTRVGLISFSGEARKHAELGSIESAGAALEALRLREDWTGSNLSDAVRRSVSLLESMPSDPTRERVVLLITDGAPTAPRDERTAAREARRSAQRAHDAGVWLYTFEIRSLDDVDTSLLADMAEVTGGRRLWVGAPEDLVFALPSRSSARVERVSIRNRTSGDEARAPRLYPSGAFDAFVPLVDGENVIEVSAELPDGSRLDAVRKIHFEKPPTEHPGELARMQSLLEEMKRRTLTTEVLGAEPWPVPPERRRSIELESDEP